VIYIYDEQTGKTLQVSGILFKTCWYLVLRFMNRVFIKCYIYTQGT